MQFSGFYTKFLDQFGNRINQIYSQARGWPGLEKDFIDGIKRYLEPMTLRCLITEIHYCKENGQLQGDNEKEEYAYFDGNYFQDSSNLEDFFKAYPSLKELLLETTDNYCQNMVEMLTRLQIDQQQINNSIFMDKKAFKKVISFKQLGDPHFGGKCVCCLTLDNNEKIIYKPRGMKYTGIFNDYLERYYTEQGLEVKKILYIDKKEYGWMEYIVQEPCSSEQEIEEYYQRLGINLFLCYLMNNRDLHFENIIAHGSYPFLVDLEVFECKRKAEKLETAEEKANELLRSSVLNIGLLPFYLENPMGKGINLSGIEAGKQQIPYLMPMVVNRKTSNIKIEYHRPFLQKAQNVPTLDGKSVFAGDYTEDIIKGFSGAYMQTMREKSSFLNGVTELEDINCRYLLRNTQQYQMLINISYWPELMTDASKRYEYIRNALGKEETDRKKQCIAAYETHRILKGDIPCFQFIPTDTSLQLGADKLENFFEKSLMQQIEEKFHALCETDKERQVRFIRQTMALAKTSDLKNAYIFPCICEQEKRVYSEEILVKAAMHLGDRITQEAVYGKHGDVNWVIPRLHMANETEWHLAPANMYLYSGISGICVFFHALNRVCGKACFQKVTEALDLTMKNYTEAVHKNRENLQSDLTGALNGEGSVAYAYQLIYRLTGKQKYFDLAVKHLEIMEELTKKCSCPDLLSGNAGAILIYINMFQITEENRYLTKAISIADQLIENAVIQKGGGIAWDIEGVSAALTGFSHGNAGIIYAFTKLYVACGLTKYKKVIEAAVQYEDYMYSDKIANWTDLRKETLEEEEKDSVSWCHGAAGILISRLEALNCNLDVITELIEKDIKRAADKVVHTKLRKGLCLCHGNFGNIEILFRYLEHEKRPELEEKLKSYMMGAAERICRDQMPFLPQEENPGFMNGFSGIGYALLKKIEYFPDILAIEI